MIVEHFMKKYLSRKHEKKEKSRAFHISCFRDYPFWFTA